MKNLVSLMFVLLVMVVEPAYAAFLNNADGTVSDLKSNLMWQRCSAPSEEVACGGVSPATYDWDSALGYCNALTLGGYTDWRLPNVKALHSILNATKSTDPAIDTTYFPDTIGDDYWSSTTAAGTAGYAWYVEFKLATFVMTSPVDKRSNLYVRCVRGGQG